MRRTTLSWLTAVALLASVNVAWAQAPTPPSSPLATILAAVEKAALDKSSADRVLTEKNVALKSSTSTIEALNEVLKKAQENKLAAERVGAAEAKANAEKTIAELEEQVKSAKAAVEKAVKEQAAATKMIQEKVAALNEANKQLTAQKTPLVKTATEASKADFDATVARENAVNVLNKKIGVANQAANVAATSKAAADKVAAEKTAAEKALLDKTNAIKTAMASVAGSQAAADKAAAERAAAEKTVVAMTAAAKAAVDKAAAAKTAADKTAAEKTAAEKGLIDRTASAKTAAAQAAGEKDAAKKKALEEASAKAAAAKTAAEKAVAALTAAAKAAAEGNTAAQAAAAKIAAEKTAADKALAALTAAAKAVADKVPPAKVALDKTTADKVALEKLIVEKTNALKAATDKANVDKAALDKARAEQNEAENNRQTKVVAEKSLRHRAAEARAIADGGLKLISEASWDLAKARHLLVRAGFGGTPQQVQELYEMGLVAAVNSLVDYQYNPAADEIPLHIEPPERPAPYENLLSPPERDRLNQRRDQKRNNDYYRLRTWWMRRLVESPRPLQEKLVLFWHGHFVSEWQKIAWAHLMYQQNQLFRDHAAGNFGGLVFGIVHDPCMIVYLDNQVNFKGRPNQNLARELMELFTLGVNQGYTEYDIREGARTLTGYTYEHYTGQFRFNLAQHDTDPKTLFGQTGPWTGDDFCNLILQQPHTARYIGLKLFEYFANPDPDAKVVAQLATVLRGNGYEMAPLLKNIFMSEEFYSAKAMGTQIKSPVQLMVGMARDFGVKGADYNYLFQVCADMGQELFQPPNVKGWYGGRDWINANLIFTRYNHTANFIRSVPQPGKGNGIDVVAFLEGKNCATAAQVVDYLAKASLATPLNEEQRRDLTEYLGQLPPPAEWAKQKDQLNAKFRQVLVLLLTTPDSQMT